MPHTLSSCCICSPSDVLHSLLTQQKFLFTLHNFLVLLHTFSPRTAIVTFLVLQTFSSNHTPCFPTADVALCDPSATAHFLSWYSRCDILDTADYLLTPHTLLLQMYTLDTVHLPSHCTTFSSNCRYDPLGASHVSPCTSDVTFLILQSFSSHHAPCLSTIDVPFFHSTPSLYLAEPSPHTVDTTLQVRKTFSPRTVNVKFLIMQTSSSHHIPCPSTEVGSHFDVVHSLLTYTFSSYCRLTLLVLHTFSPRTEAVTFLILHTFCSHHTHCPPTADVALLIHFVLTLHNLLLILQIQQFWYCILSLLLLQI